MKARLKKNLLIGWLLPCVATAIALPSFAQSSTAPAAPAAPAAVAQQAPGARELMRDARASELLRKEVVSTKGEKLGKIDDLIVDVSGGRVYYAILSFGGMLGLGDKLFPYPVSSFRAGAGPDVLVLDVDKEKLKKAPGFESKRHPNWNEESYRSEIDRYFFKEDSARRIPGGARLVSAKGLIGKNINDRAAHNIGEVADLVINFGKGQVRYLVMRSDKANQSGQKMLVLPLSVFIFPSRPDLDIVLTLQEDKLNAARGFDKDKWPDLNDPNYLKGMDSYLSGFQVASGAQPPVGQSAPRTPPGPSK